MVPADRHPPEPPSGPWVMIQRWHNLLFAHWQCALSDLRPLIPAPLEIETFDGAPWIGVIPFHMTGVRMRGAPPLPTANAFLELNVRTYVTLDGVPGVWFFSLDCESTLAVIGARMGVSLPYFRADMRMRPGEKGFEYDSQRWAVAGPPAAFSGSYRGVGSAAAPPPGTLDHFLTERYCLYSSDGKRIWRADIFHPRWSLRDAEAQIDTNSMIAAAGVRATPHPPLLHFAEFQEVHFWWPVQVR